MVVEHLSFNLSLAVSSCSFPLLLPSSFLFSIWNSFSVVCVDLKKWAQEDTLQQQADSELQNRLSLIYAPH